MKHKILLSILALSSVLFFEGTLAQPIEDNIEITKPCIACAPIVVYINKGREIKILPNARLLLQFEPTLKKPKPYFVETNGKGVFNLSILLQKHKIKAFLTRGEVIFSRCSSEYTPVLKKEIVLTGSDCSR